VLTTEEHSLAEIGHKPVSDALPCGENARYEADFEQLEAELAKQESLTSATVDWGKIVDISSLIIRAKSKDILVGSYLCYGLLLKEGYQGLAVGLKILCDMSEQHWDCLFPPTKRMRARQTAFVWLAEKAGLIVADKTPVANESRFVIEAMDYLKQLDNILVDKMGDQAPMFTDLSRPLKNYAQSAKAEQEKSQPTAVKTEKPVEQAQENSAPPAPAPEQQTAIAEEIVQESPVSTPAANKSGASAKAEISGSIESENDSKKTLRQIQASTRDVSGFWLAQKLSDPRAYRINRVAAWIIVENAPPANDGITQINPPAAERLKFFESLKAKGDHLALLAELEKTLARAPFWLDGQFLVATSLRALGAEFQSALQAVIDETANFLKRLPELVDLCFSDQSPFASDQTRLWLESEVLTSTSAGKTGKPVQGARAEDWDATLGEASQIAASGDIAKALSVMHDGLQKAGSPRSQMYWRCALSTLLLQTGEASSASNILEQLAAQLEKNKIKLYEPELLAHTYTLLFQSYQKQQKKNKDDEGLKEKVDKAYAKLCWFDPVTALSVRGG
jgi:type VI secretion system protein VasJ